MTSRTRWILRVLAWSAFVTIAPLLILSALGHRIWSTTARPEAVGTFLIRTFPRGATITVDGTKYGTRSPTAVRSVTPGTHEVQIEKSGYRPWSKRLEIIGTRITDIRHVRLSPLTVEEDILFPRVETFIPSPSEERALVVERERNTRILRIVSLVNPIEPGIRIAERLSKSAQVTATWSPDQTFILMTIHDGSRRRALLVQSATGLPTPVLASEVPIGWVGSSGHTIAIRRTDTLLLRTVGGEEGVVSQAVTHASPSSFGLAYSSTATTEDERTQRTPIHLFLIEDQGTPRQIPIPPTSLSVDDTISLSPRGDILIRYSTGGTSVLWDHEHERWVPLTASGERFQWSPDGTKILWQSSEFDIWVMNLHEERTVLPPLAPELLIRLSQSARNVRWFPDSQHVLFLDRDVVKAIEIDGRDGHRIESLIGTNRGDAIATVIPDGTSLVTTAMRDGTPVLLRAFLRTPEDR